MKKEKFIKGDYPLVKKWRTTGMASSYVWIVIVSPSQKWERMIEEDIKADGFKGNIDAVWYDVIGPWVGIAIVVAATEAEAKNKATRAMRVRNKFPIAYGSYETAKKLGKFRINAYIANDEEPIYRVQILDPMSSKFTKYLYRMW